MSEKLIQEESMKMVKAFNDEFFIPYLENNTMENKYATNVVLSFACSAFLSIVVPILTSTHSPKRAIDDINGILNDMRNIMHRAVKETRIKNKVIN